MDRDQIAEGLLVHLSNLLSREEGVAFPIGVGEDGKMFDYSGNGFLAEAKGLINTAINLSYGQPSGLTRPQAEHLAKAIKNSGLKSLALAAAKEITNWEEPTRLNGGITKGKFWNMYVPGMDFDKRISNSIKVNFLIEFGHLLPPEIIPPVKKRNGGKPIHQEPDLSRFIDKVAEMGPEDLTEEE